MNEKYDYMVAVENDIRTYLEENNIVITSENKEEMFEELTERLWVEDSVTGNASGSYTFSTWKAEEYLCHNLDLLAEACEEFGSNIDILKDGAEACDVTIRCYLLSECLNNVLDDVEVESVDEEEDIESLI